MYVPTADLPRPPRCSSHVLKPLLSNVACPDFVEGARRRAVDGPFRPNPVDERQSKPERCSATTCCRRPQRLGVGHGFQRQLGERSSKRASQTATRFRNTHQPRAGLVVRVPGCRVPLPSMRSLLVGYLDPLHHIQIPLLAGYLSVPAASGRSGSCYGTSSGTRAPARLHAEALVDRLIAVELARVRAAL